MVLFFGEQWSNEKPAALMRIVADFLVMFDKTVSDVLTMRAKEEMVRLTLWISPGVWYSAHLPQWINLAVQEAANNSHPPLSLRYRAVASAQIGHTECAVTLQEPKLRFRHKV